MKLGEIKAMSCDDLVAKYNKLHDLKKRYPRIHRGFGPSMQLLVDEYQRRMLNGESSKFYLGDNREKQNENSI